MGMWCGHWEVGFGVNGGNKKKGLLAPLQFWTLNVKTMIVAKRLWQKHCKFVLVNIKRPTKIELGVNNSFLLIQFSLANLQLHQRSITPLLMRQWIRMMKCIWTAQLMDFLHLQSFGPDSLTTAMFPCRWISEEERTKVAIDAQLIMVLVIQILLMSL